MIPSAESPYSKHGRLLRRLVDFGDPEFSKVLLLERIVLSTLCIVLLMSPSMAVRWAAGRISRTIRKLAIEIYVLTKTLVCFIFLFGGLWVAAWYPLVCVICLADLFANISAIILLRGIWRAPLTLNRTLLSLGVNFAEYTAWFAGLYLHYGSLFQNNEVIKAPFDAYYFSVVTAATVGFGDIIPSADGRRIVVCEILCSLLFLAIIVAYIIGSLNSSPTDKSETPKA